MTASLSWLEPTADDRDKVRRVLGLFNEQGTVDALGVKRTVIKRCLENAVRWSDSFPAWRRCKPTNNPIG